MDDKKASEKWKIEWEKKEAKKGLALAAVVEALRNAGIRMQVGGCGCCDSPWVKVEVNGVIIADEDYFRFDMFKDDANGQG